MFEEDLYVITLEVSLKKERVTVKLHCYKGPGIIT